MPTRRPVSRPFFIAFAILSVTLLIIGALAYEYRGHIKALLGPEHREQIKALVATTWNAAVALRPIDDRPRVGAQDGGSNILLVVLDACRPDKLGSYGFERETSATIDELARDPDAVTFLNHHVQASWTKPSTASLFTGLFPSDHGIVLGILENSDNASDRRYRTQVLSPDAATLAEVLRDAGFYTFGVVSPHHVGAEYGFDQGFAEYHGITAWPGGDQQRLSTTTELIESITGKFFGYVHFMACHAPFERRYRDADYMASYSFDYDENAQRKAGIDFTRSAIIGRVNDGEIALSDEDVKFLHLIYEAKLRWADQALVRPLIQILRDSGRYDDTLILITADHGEELYEHGQVAHGHALWNELMHVPLIAKYPKGRKPKGFGPQVTALTSSVDLYPSLLALAGLPSPQGLRGVPALKGIFARHALAEQAEDCSPEQLETCEFERALITEGFKLIVGPDGHPPLLFDIERDPVERRSLTAALPKRVARMSSRISQLAEEKVIKVTAPSLNTDLSEDKLKELRGLGYIQ
jgi:arylsulfatase A-like enzyme